MHYPHEWYQMTETITEHFTHLRPAQQRGLSLWVFGSILARSSCQNAVISALLVFGCWHNLRQQLREWLYDGCDKAAPCDAEVNVSLCFESLLRWLLTWWQGQKIALAIDATAHQDRVVALTVSVLYRGCAIPIAWHIVSANQKGAWMPHILRLLRLLKRAMPNSMQVLVMMDRGLFSGRLYKRIRDLGWHPVMRLKCNTNCQPEGKSRQKALELVPGPGHAWVGKGTVFNDRKRHGTLLVVWGSNEKEPWVLLTDLVPERAGLWWYGLRVWIELGFRALKGMGWRWEHTRRIDPTRVARHWLVLAVATMWTLAYGTRAEDALEEGKSPAYLHAPPTKPYPPNQRKTRRHTSLFQLGLTWFTHQLGRGELWHRLWLRPEQWPDPPVQLVVTYHAAA